MSIGNVWRAISSWLSGFTRERLQLVLAAFWALDGALQLQPAMFTRRFANEVIAPLAAGQPGLISGAVHAATHMILLQPAAFNATFGTLQLVIAAGILYPRTTRLALAASVAWALAIWYAGEGLGGLFSGPATLLMGAPGAALLYAVLGLAAWPSKRLDTDLPPAWLKRAWAGLWIGGAVVQLWPGNNNSDDLWNAVMGNAMDAPGWLAFIDQHIANILPVDSYIIAFDIAVVQLFIGVAMLRSRRLGTWAVGAGAAVMLLYWVSGQGLGEYWTGLATDPNTAPLVVVLGLAALASTANEAK